MLDVLSAIECLRVRATMNCVHGQGAYSRPYVAVFYNNAAVERASCFQARFLGCDFAISASVRRIASVF
jgi:hypothetical protein